MSTRFALRLAAIVIAIAGLFDPALTVSRSVPQPLTIAILGSPGDAAYRAAGELQSKVADLYEPLVRSQTIETDASPCPSAGACVVISDGAAPRRLSSSGLVGAIRIEPTRQPAVAIKRVTTSSNLHPGARGVLDVVLDKKSGNEPATVRVYDGDVLVGESATRRIEWTPIASGLRDLRVATTDDETHVGVEVTQEQYQVLFYEPRPTWSGTFIRRALEADPRFVLHSRATVAHNITVSTAAGPLDVASLERVDPHVVIVSALEQLSAGEVSALEQFMTRRGGSVVALVDRALTGAGRALLPSATTDRREAQPVPIGPLKGAEFLTFAPDVVTTVLATANHAPVIVSRPVGNGVLIASGASDAWRFRHESAAFTAFWQGLVADAAEAAGEPLAITLDKRLAEPGSRMRVAVEWRPLRGVPASIDARAAVSCADIARPVRLWPDAGRGRFEGEFVPPAAGECSVTASLNGTSSSTSLLVRETPNISSDAEDTLSTTIGAYGGTVVKAGDEDALVTALRRSALPTRTSTQMHPLRSPWWIAPFAACLGGEWWLRRRSGLK